MDIAAAGHWPSFADFPKEVQKQILGALDNTDLANFAMTSKQSNHFVHSQVGFNLFVGRSRPLPYVDIPKHGSVKVLTKYGIRTCTIGNTTQSKKLASFLHPELLEEITFHGQINVCKLRSLLTPDSAQNLKRLTFSLYSLMHMSMKQDRRGKSNVLVDFPNLQMLMLSGQPSNMSSWQIWDGSKTKSLRDHMFANANYLLRKVKAPKLSEVVLQSVQIQGNQQEVSLMMSVWACVVNHKASLKKLSIGILSQIPDNEAEESADQQLAALDFVQMRNEVSGLQLESLFFKNFRQTKNPPERTSQLLRLIMDANKPNPKTKFTVTDDDHATLQHMVWMAYHNKRAGEEFQLATLLANHHRTLKSIELAVPTSHADISCGLFSNCHSLKILTLILTGVLKLVKDVNPGSQGTKLSHLNLLPPGLTSLRVHNMRIRTVDTDLTHLRSLKCLEVINIGRKPGFGLSMANFIKLLDEKRVSLVYFKKALNEDSFAGGGSFIEYAYRTADQDLKGTLLKLMGNTYDPQTTYHRVDDIQHGENYPLYSFHDSRSNYFRNISVPFPATNLGFKEVTFIHYDDVHTARDEAILDEYREEEAEFEDGNSANENIVEEGLTVVGHEEMEPDLEDDEDDDEDDEDVGNENEDGGEEGEVEQEEDVDEVDEEDDADGEEEDEDGDDAEEAEPIQDQNEVDADVNAQNEDQDAEEEEEDDEPADDDEEAGGGDGDHEPALDSDGEEMDIDDADDYEQNSDEDEDNDND